MRFIKETIALLAVVLLFTNCSNSKFAGEYEYTGEHNQFISNINIDKVYFKIKKHRENDFILTMINPETDQEKQIGILVAKNGNLEEAGELKEGVWLRDNKIYMTIKVNLFGETTFGPWENDDIDYEDTVQAASGKSKYLTVDEVPPEEILVQINKEVITADEFNKIIDINPRTSKILKNKPAALKNILDFVINQRLLAKKAREKGYDEDPEIKKQLGNLKKGLSIKKDMSESDIDEYMNRMKDLLIASRMMQDINSDAVDKIDDEDLKQYYRENKKDFYTPEQVKASQILIKVSKNANKDSVIKAENKIKKALEEIKSGKDFAEAAREYSDDPSKYNGGDLGYFSRGRMEPEFYEAAFSLNKIGDISDIIRTKQGFHIIKLTDKKKASQMSFDEAKDKIELSLKHKIKQNAVKEYLDKIKAETDIKINEKLLAKIVDKR